MNMVLFRRLGPLDARLVGRDSLLRGMLVVPFGAALAIRFVLPLIFMRVAPALGADPAPLIAAVSSGALLLIAPVIYGIVTGFLLLDQRDEHTLLAIAVTPLSLGRYLAYRMVVPTLLAALVTPLVLLVGGATSFALANVLLASLAAAPVTPLLALAFVALAENKVQGMALQKAFSVLLILPMGGLLAPMPLAWAFGLLPTMWPLWALWWPLPAGLCAAAAGLLYAALVLWLLRRTVRVAG